MQFCQCCNGEVVKATLSHDKVCLDCGAVQSETKFDSGGLASSGTNSCELVTDPKSTGCGLFDTEGVAFSQARSRVALARYLGVPNSKLDIGDNAPTPLAKKLCHSLKGHANSLGIRQPCDLERVRLALRQLSSKMPRCQERKLRGYLACLLHLLCPNVPLVKARHVCQASSRGGLSLLIHTKQFLIEHGWKLAAAANLSTASTADVKDESEYKSVEDEADFLNLLSPMGRGEAGANLTADAAVLTDILSASWPTCGIARSRLRCLGLYLALLKLGLDRNQALACFAAPLSARDRHLCSEASRQAMRLLRLHPLLRSRSQNLTEAKLSRYLQDLIDFRHQLVSERLKLAGHADCPI